MSRFPSRAAIREYVLGALPFVYPWYDDVAETTDGLTWWDPIDEAQVGVQWSEIQWTIHDLGVGNKGHGDPARANSWLLLAGLFDEVDYDSDSADVVIQRAAFGEVRYA